MTEDTGYFWFFDPAIPELAVKILDGRAVNGHFWVFYGALTDVGFNLTIYNLVTGERKVYTNPPGVQASRVDTLAFEDGSAPLSGSQSYQFASAGPELPLANGRFKVDVAWRTPTGASGSGTPFPLTADSGAFWFFNDQNLELFAKVVDGRGVNGHYWIFYGALTDLDYDLSVTDTQTGAVKVYHGRQGVVSSGYDIGTF